MSNIIVPERPPIVLGVGVRGRFKFIRRRGDESIVEETPFGKNMWLDTGLDWLCGSSRFSSSFNLDGCHVGAGNTPPENDDQTLESFVAGVGGTHSSTHIVDAEARFNRYIVVFRFPVGAAAGNLSEVGISLGTSNTAGSPSAQLATRALITDEGGNPVTISPQPDEILDVVWEYTKYAPADDVTGSFQQEIDGAMVDFEYIVRPSTTSSSSDGWGNLHRSQLGVATGGSNRGRSGAHPGALGGVFGSPTPLNSIQASTSYEQLGSYVDGTFYRDSRLFFGLDRGNVDIRVLNFNNSICAWQMQIDPVVQKVPNKQYYIDIRNTIGRYEP